MTQLAGNDSEKRIVTPELYDERSITMRKRKLRIVAIILVMAMLLGMLTGCGERKAVREMLESFESACQSFDVAKIIEHIDPVISGPVLGIAGLLGIEDTSGLLETVVDFLSIFGDAGMEFEALLQSIEIEIDGYEFNDDKDACEVSATISYGAEEDRTEDVVTFSCILDNEVWYIAGVSDR